MTDDKYRAPEGMTLEGRVFRPATLAELAEAVAAGFPDELPDGSRRVPGRYLFFTRGSTTASSSTRVKKAVA